MKIFEEYTENENDLIEIESAKFVGDFKIDILFKNGTQRLVCFKAFLEASSHPSIKKYLNEDRFVEFKIIDGNLNWNDYDLIFPVYDLYVGQI